MKLYRYVKMTICGFTGIHKVEPLLGIQHLNL